MKNQPIVYSIRLTEHTGNQGRWGVLRGTVQGHRCDLVHVLVFSHDEKWYLQKPAIPVKTFRSLVRTFQTDVAFGLNDLSPQGREYIAVACVSPEPLPTEAVYSSLNDLPPGCVLSPPISVARTDASEGA